MLKFFIPIWCLIVILVCDSVTVTNGGLIVILVNALDDFFHCPCSTTNPPIFFGIKKIRFSSSPSNDVLLTKLSVELDVCDP